MNLILKEFQTAEFIQNRALQSTARVVVFPETVVFRWSEATDLFWEDSLKKLAAAGKTVLVGAGVALPGSAKYHNAVIIRGSTTESLLQRIPVPIGMWNPLTNGGVPMGLHGTGIMRIGGQRAVILICYEQFLTWPILSSAPLQPNILIGIANDHWAPHSNIPPIRLILLRLWARLFAIPYLKVFLAAKTAFSSGFRNFTTVGMRIFIVHRPNSANGASTCCPHRSTLAFALNANHTSVALK